MRSPKHRPIAEHHERLCQACQSDAARLRRYAQPAADLAEPAARHGRSRAAPVREGDGRFGCLRRGGLSRHVLASIRACRIYNFYAICFVPEKW
jgi:hypothetical protein